MPALVNKKFLTYLNYLLRITSDFDYVDQKREEDERETVDLNNKDICFTVNFLSFFRNKI